MDFQELTLLWNSTDHELDRQIEIKKKLVKETGMRKVRSHLTGLKWNALFELAANLPFLWFICRYLADNFSDMKFFIPGLLLLALTVGSVFFSVYRLALYFGISAETSVVQNQLKVVRLRYLESLEANLLWVAIPLFYAPFLIVMARAIAHYDLYRQSSWLITGTMGSIVVALIIVFFLKKFPSKRLLETQSFLNELRATE